jgi:hypothetical protein
MQGPGQVRFPHNRLRSRRAKIESSGAAGDADVVMIANSRLTQLADGQVSFTWSDYRERGKTEV